MKNLSLYDCQGVIVKDVTFKDVVIIGEIQISIFKQQNFKMKFQILIARHTRLNTDDSLKLVLLVLSSLHLLCYEVVCGTGVKKFFYNKKFNTIPRLVRSTVCFSSHRAIFIISGTILKIRWNHLSYQPLSTQTKYDAKPHTMCHIQSNKQKINSVDA